DSSSRPASTAQRALYPPRRDHAIRRGSVTPLFAPRSPPTKTCPPCSAPRESSLYAIQRITISICWRARRSLLSLETASAAVKRRPPPHRPTPPGAPPPPSRRPPAG